MGQQGGTSAILNPARVIPLAFLAGITAGTLLLMLPAARAGEGHAPFIVALFTATSALCVTGLTVVDTPSYWSGLGHLFILALAQVGGFGIMTGATLLGLLMSGRNRLSTRILAGAEMRSLDLGDVSGVVRIVVVATFSVEGVLALVMAADFWWLKGMPPLEALWYGLFHAVSAWNNAGFNLEGVSGASMAGDYPLLFALITGVVLGGLGFPVLYELRKEWRTPATWSIHTKLTVAGSTLLLLLGWMFVLAAEWGNKATLGGMGTGQALVNALFHSVMTRSGGFATFDMTAMHDETLALTHALMMIGGGSASTAGGIKVTTFFLLGFVALAEFRGHADANAFGRRIPVEVQRQALLIALLAVGTVGLGFLLLLMMSDLPFAFLLFDAISAFATVGLSTGVAAALPPEGQAVLVLLMYVGRVGTISVAAAVALHVGQPRYRYPEERPIIG
ncbi:TrkH family potassium uptake protein [Thermaurantiacus sp.]